MVSAPIPPNEMQRLAALRLLNILDTPAEERFERITRLAQRIYGVPIALISLVDAERQWFKSHLGLEVEEVHRNLAFCAHTILSEETFVVKDATKDERFATNPLVLEDPSIRFYAGQPLHTLDGSRVGSLCIIDRVPRAELSAEDQATLRDLAGLVEDELNLTEAAHLQASLTKVNADLSEEIAQRQKSEGKLRASYAERKKIEDQVQAQNESLVKANRALAVARRQAEAANKLKSQFLATMSHELRTPLNAIIGYSQLQISGMVGPMTDEHAGYQERILINAQHLLRLINEVLDLSKIEAGRMELLEKPFSLRGLIDEVVAQNQILAEQKSLPLTVIYDDRLPSQVIGDVARLKQIMINLLSNAVKFTKVGVIKLEAQRLNKDDWKFTVSDTGIGIPSHMQETVFEEFRQVDDASSRQHGGTGLGLAIVRRLVLMMGGSIRLTSSSNVGSQFAVTLPLITDYGDDHQAAPEIIMLESIVEGIDGPTSAIEFTEMKGL